MDKKNEFSLNSDGCKFGCQQFAVLIISVNCSLFFFLLKLRHSSHVVYACVIVNYFEIFSPCDANGEAW